MGMNASNLLDYVTSLLVSLRIRYTFPNLWSEWSHIWVYKWSGMCHNALLRSILEFFINQWNTSRVLDWGSRMLYFYYGTYCGFRSTETKEGIEWHKQPLGIVIFAEDCQLVTFEYFDLGRSKAYILHGAILGFLKNVLISERKGVILYIYMV